MMRITLLCVLFLLTACGKKGGDMPEPKAEKIDHKTKIGDVTLHDDYAWMRSKDWPGEIQEEKILSHLKAENEYTAHFLKPLDAVKDKFFNEIKGRIQLDDMSAYVKVDNYYYYTRTEKDKDYPIYCRRFGSLESAEEIILDVNKLAEGKKFTKVSAVSVDPTHSKLAYGVDFIGDEKYQIRILDLESGKYAADVIDNTVGDIVWHRLMPGFFYTPVNEDHKMTKVMYHEIGNNIDRKIFEETAHQYMVGIRESNSRKYLFIDSGDHAENASHMLSLESDEFDPKLIRGMVKGIKYEVEHNGDYIYMMTNDTGPNFRVARSLISNLSDNNWSEYIPMDRDKSLHGFDMSEDYLVLNYKVKGLPLVKILHMKEGQAQTVSFPEETYTAKGFSTNFVENDLRVNYSSLARPNTTYTYDFAKNKLNILKEQEIPSGHNPDDYMVKRIWADNNGVKVPISLVYKKALFKNDGTNPLYLYGYGAYGIAMEPSFRSSIVSLLDRGFVYAIAHVRGGDELGYQWYLDGKLLNKKNTMDDFIACAETLISQNYTGKGYIVSSGGSAGGILVGAAANMRPDLFKAVVTHVPFVDVLNTMLDHSLPLTMIEYNEWGNPNEKEYFDYIKSYSPYDNVTEQEYPYVFASAGVSDSRVGYWEAAKWVAKLRQMNESDNLIFLKINMNSGHGLASSRFDAMEEVAEEFTFITKIFDTKM